VHWDAVQQGIPPPPQSVSNMSGTDQPGAGWDLIFCRHMMFHLTPADNLRILRNVDASGAK
jgi:hypothetical protein